MLFFFGRFSLRRLFYGNSLLAQPFLPNPLGSNVAMSSSQRRNSSSKHRRRHKGAASGGGASVSSRDGVDTGWRDNMSSGSGAALTTVGPDGRVVSLTYTLLNLAILFYLSILSVVDEGVHVVRAVVAD